MIVIPARAREYVQADANLDDGIAVPRTVCAISRRADGTVNHIRAAMGHS